MKRNKTKFLLVCVILLLGARASGQVDFNDSKDFGVSLNYYTYQGPQSVSAFLQYRSNKNCFFAGYGLRKNTHPSYRPEPEAELWIGYKRYPFNNQKHLKFFYQTFLFYTADHAVNTEFSVSYITLNYGAGLEYNFTKRFYASLSTNFGIGVEFGNDNEFRTKLIPILTSIGYKFNIKN